ncbi:MAG: hypothetical protein AAF821_08245 [Cyanobacteria bacterium P01_D01_bin.156]
MSNYEEGLPLEDFIQALTSQLDRAQKSMSLKAQFGLPLTFALKELSIDLRAHVDMAKSQILIRPAGPNAKETSVLHFDFTTITRPMIEENTFTAEADEPSLKEVLGDDITEEEQRRLEWAGIHSVSQLRELQQQKNENVVEQISQIPAMRLRAALKRASQPQVKQVLPEGTSRMRIRGFNLAQEKQPPTVRINGENVQILESTTKELVVDYPGSHMSGALQVETAPGMVAETNFDWASADVIDVGMPEIVTNSGGDI